jgi:arylsulfatase
MRSSLPAWLFAFAFSLLACGNEPPPVKLLLLISVDTLRADHLGTYGSQRDLTPHLDALADESQVFEIAYAPAPFTLPSVAALLSGRYPETLGVVSNASTMPDSVPTLATELAARGWRTAAVVSNLALGRKAGLAVGFDFYDDALPQREAVRDWPERVAASTTDAALAALDVLRSPPDTKALLWVHYVDPHGPYTPPDGLRERYLPGERTAFDGRRKLPVGPGLDAIPTYQYLEGQHELAFYRAGYAGEVRYVDAEIGRLLEGVDARGLRRHTWVVFTADHGESLGERGQYFHHSDFLTDALVRVPLLVRRPGVAPARRRDLASLVDLAPSLLAELTGEPTDRSRPGRNLFAPGAQEEAGAAYLATLRGGRRTAFGLVAEGHKLVTSRERDGWDTRLFRAGDDDVDLSGAFAERSRALERRLQTLRSDLSGADEVRQELSEVERERLRALGYLVGGAADAAPR